MAIKDISAYFLHLDFSFFAIKFKLINEADIFF